MAHRLRVGDVGTVITLRIYDQDAAVVDLSTTTLRQIVFTGPDGAQQTETATLTAGGTDGRMQYTTVAGDINLPGRWVAHAVIEFSSGAQHWTSTPVYFDAEGL